MDLTSNYLDHLDTRLEKQGGRDSLARLLLVARKGEAAEDADAVVQYHERVSHSINFKDEAARYPHSTQSKDASPASDFRRQSF